MLHLWKGTNDWIFQEFSLLLLSFSEIRNQKMIVYMTSREQSNGVARPLPRTRGAEGSVAERRVSSFSSLSQSINLIPTASSSAQAACFYEPEWGTWFAVSGSRNNNFKRTKTETNGGATGADLLSCRACACPRTCAAAFFFLCFDVHTKTCFRCGWIPGVTWGEVECAAPWQTDREKKEVYVTVGVTTFWSFCGQGKLGFFFSAVVMTLFCRCAGRTTDPPWKCSTMSSNSQQIHLTTGLLE